MGNYIYPAKYLKTDWGLIALISGLTESGEYRKVRLTESVRAEVFPDGMMGVVSGEVVLPIPEGLLDFIISNPKIQISVITDKLIDEDHALLDINLPALYELKGLWKARRQHQSSGVQELSTVT